MSARNNQRHKDAGPRLTGLLVPALLVAAIAIFAIHHGMIPLSALPFGLLLICSLMHLFVHGRHGAHDGRAVHGGKP